MGSILSYVEKFTWDQANCFYKETKILIILNICRICLNTGSGVHRGGGVWAYAPPPLPSKKYVKWRKKWKKSSKKLENAFQSGRNPRRNARGGGLRHPFWKIVCTPLSMTHEEFECPLSKAKTYTRYSDDILVRLPGRLSFEIIGFRFVCIIFAFSWLLFKKLKIGN